MSYIIKVLKPGIKFLLILIKNYCSSQSVARIFSNQAAGSSDCTGPGLRFCGGTNKSYGLMWGLLLWSEITVMGRQIDFWLNLISGSSIMNHAWIYFTLSLQFRLKPGVEFPDQSNGKGKLHIYNQLDFTKYMFTFLAKSYH